MRSADFRTSEEGSNSYAFSGDERAQSTTPVTSMKIERSTAVLGIGTGLAINMVCHELPPIVTDERGSESISDTIK